MFDHKFLRDLRTIFLVLALFAAAIPQLLPGRAAAEGAWISPHYRDHRLAGTIWTSRLEQVTQAELVGALSRARFVLLGEIHDNPDHHRLQAELIGALVKRGRRPAIVLEMVPVSLQGELDRFGQAGSADASALGNALKWRERGWPDWAMYQPIAEAALAARLRLIAGGLDREAQNVIAKAAPADRFGEAVRMFGLDEPLEAPIAEAENAELKAGHCNLLPDAALAPMLRVQRALDASLADAITRQGAGDGAVLIAGAGHVRNEWAVPRAIRRRMPDAAVISVALVEVDPSRDSPPAYLAQLAGLPMPFDFIYLTPKANLTDHCAELRKHMERKKGR